MPERDGIPALQSGRATIERALELAAPVWVLRVLLVVIADTALWSRFEAPVTHRRIADLTSMPQRQISRAFAWLMDNDVLGYKAGYSLPNGPRSSSIVTLTMDRTDPRSLEPTVTKSPHHGPQGVATVGLGSPPIGDPSGITRNGAAAGGAPSYRRAPARVGGAANDPGSRPSLVRPDCPDCHGCGYQEDGEGNAVPCFCRTKKSA